jgi:hypothetical protein
VPWCSQSWLQPAFQPVGRDYASKDGSHREQNSLKPASFGTSLDTITSVRAKVLFFGMLKDIAGRSEDYIEVGAVLGFEDKCCLGP